MCHQFWCGLGTHWIGNLVLAHILFLQNIVLIYSYSHRFKRGMNNFSLELFSDIIFQNNGDTLWRSWTPPINGWRMMLPDFRYFLSNIDDAWWTPPYKRVTHDGFCSMFFFWKYWWRMVTRVDLTFSINCWHIVMLFFPILFFKILVTHGDARGLRSHNKGNEVVTSVFCYCFHILVTHGDFAPQ